MALHKTPKRSRADLFAQSPDDRDRSPVFSSPVYQSGGASGSSVESKRGRPRSEIISNLMIEGSISPSAIKCKFCNRVFPREKSLIAHIRIHTGERPYTCSYPGCTRAFTQSGQLKTHQRLHTGERPFVCSAENCDRRFTHANRHCPEHPYSSLRRSDDFSFSAVPEQNAEVLRWLENYRREREDKTPTRRTPKRPKAGCSQRDNIENENETPRSPSTPYKSRKGLMCELDMNAGMAASPLSGRSQPNTPKLIQWGQQEESEDEGECSLATSTFRNPKKKWLHDAWQDDLARPLEATTTAPPSPTVRLANQNRPTVLFVAKQDKAIPLEVPKVVEPAAEPEPEPRKWMGALALMQLGTGGGETAAMTMAGAAPEPSTDDV